MKKRHLVFLAVVILICAFLTGCATDEIDLDGKNIVKFVMNGGTLDYKTSRTDTEIFFAYHPGSYILDPESEIPGYQLYRTGYNFTAWYTDDKCTPGNEWDFKTPFDVAELTLYAGWEKAIVHSYTLVYSDGANEVVLGSYTVSAGDAFEDWRGYADSRSGHTPMGFYSDSALTTPWDDSSRHPGGEADNDVKVYVKYIEGEWTFVDSYDGLCNAIKNGKNAYLTADIDCGGKELSFKTYKGTIEGNGHKISSFKVSKAGTKFYPTCVIFDELGEGASIRNLSFTEATFELYGISDIMREIYIAALANSSKGATICSVTVSGVVKTDYSGELARLNEAIYEPSDKDSVADFTSSLTINLDSNN